jgi:ABC-type sulfate transport system permease component
VFCDVELPLLVLATVTGALTFAGAFAEAAGFTDGELTWEVTCAVPVPAVSTAAWAGGALTVALGISDG